MQQHDISAHTYGYMIVVIKKKTISYQLTMYLFNDKLLIENPLCIFGLSCFLKLFPFQIIYRETNHIHSKDFSIKKFEFQKNPMNLKRKLRAQNDFNINTLFKP